MWHKDTVDTGQNVITALSSLYSAPSDAYKSTAPWPFCPQPQRKPCKYQAGPECCSPTLSSPPGCEMTPPTKEIVGRVATWGPPPQTAALWWTSQVPGWRPTWKHTFPKTSVTNAAPATFLSSDKPLSQCSMERCRRRLSRKVRRCHVAVRHFGAGSEYCEAALTLVLDEVLALRQAPGKDSVLPSWASSKERSLIFQGCRFDFGQSQLPSHLSSWTSPPSNRLASCPLTTVNPP